MFTGLVEDVGRLVSRELAGGRGKLVVETALPVAEIAIGDSIAVNGVCLTVESRTGAGTLRFHTLGETLERSNLGAVPLGGRVNLERAMQIGGRLGGHLVQGHVDATAAIRAIGRSADDMVATIGLPAGLAHLVIEKGSIAVNGISLTIAALTEDSFSVHLIPHTWQATNLRDARVGDRVNLEADMIGKYILRQKQLAGGGGSPSTLSMQSLHDAGW